MPIARPMPGAITSSADFFTNFPTTENPISTNGAIWVNGGDVGLNWTNCQAANGRIAATSIELAPPPYNDSICHLSTAYRTFAANQFAQGTVYRAPGYTFGHESLLLLRFAISANVARGYEIYWSTNGGIALVRWNGAVNDFIVLASASPGIANTGDVVRAEIVGSNITVKINGSIVIGPFSDTTWAAGQPGAGNNPWQAGSDFFSYGWDDYTAGNL